MIMIMNMIMMMNSTMIMDYDNEHDYDKDYYDNSNDCDDLIRTIIMIIS